MFQKVYWSRLSSNSNKNGANARIIQSALFFLLLCNFQSLGQTIRGVIRDKNSQEGIPYANISVINKNIRSIAQSDGQFVLDISNVNRADSIKFSCIGYVSGTYSLNVLDTAKKQEFFLEPAVYAIEPVTIFGTKRETATIGYPKAHRRMTGWGDFESNRGRTRGVIIKGIKCPSKVKSFFFRINHNDWDSVALRLNFLSIENGKVGESILRENIIFHTSQKHRWVEVNLEKYEIVLCGEILATLEWVDAQGSIGEYSNVLTLSLSNEEGLVYSREANEEIGTIMPDKHVPAMYIEVYKTD